MFHVYFGAFDFVVYAIAAMFAIYLANAICSEMEEREGLKRLEVKKADATRSGEKAEDAPLILSGQIFELRGTLVVKQSDIPILLPEGMKVFSMRGNPVIRLSDLQNVCGTVAIDAMQVIQKWEQWSQQKRKNKPRKRRRPTTEAASMNGGARNGTTSDVSV